MESPYEKEVQGETVTVVETVVVEKEVEVEKVVTVEVEKEVVAEAEDPGNWDVHVRDWVPECTDETEDAGN